MTCGTACGEFRQRFLIFFFLVRSHQNVKKAGDVYVKLIPSTSRTRSSYPAVTTLPSGVDASPETRFVCPSPVRGVAAPVES